MSHFFYSCHFSEFSDYIETRESTRLIHQVEHRMLRELLISELYYCRDRKLSLQINSISLELVYVFKFWIGGIAWMREESRLLCPGNFSISEESSVTENVEVSKIKKNSTNYIRSFDKMCTHISTKTVLKTLSAICWILPIVSHYPISILWDNELISLDVFRKIGVTTIRECQIWLMELNKFLSSGYLDHYESIFEFDDITWKCNNSFDIVFTGFINMGLNNHYISPYWISYMDRDFLPERSQVSYGCTICRISDILCKIKIWELINENKFLIVITSFHGLSIDLKWCYYKSPNKKYNNKNYDKISQKSNKFWKWRVYFFEIFINEWCVWFGHGLYYKRNIVFYGFLYDK